MVKIGPVIFEIALSEKTQEIDIAFSMAILTWEVRENEIPKFLKTLAAVF